MTIHKEGYKTIFIIGMGVFILIMLSLQYIYPTQPLIHNFLSVVLSAFWLFIVSFFRIPSRDFTNDESAIVSPADGKVVVIEEVHDT